MGAHSRLPTLAIPACVGYTGQGVRVVVPSNEKASRPPVKCPPWGGGGKAGHSQKPNSVHVWYNHCRSPKPDAWGSVSFNCATVCAREALRHRCPRLCRTIWEREAAHSLLKPREMGPRPCPHPLEVQSVGRQGGNLVTCEPRGWG